MASQTQGIQQLLAAEKRAAEKVAEARKRKARRLKQAKEEAQAEIDNYRKEREQQFRDYEAKHMGSRDDIAQKIDIETTKKINEINGMVASQRESMVNMLLKLVFEIKPEVHTNVKLQKRG